MSGASIKKIWEWIKTTVSKIADLIPRRLRREVPAEPEPAPHVNKALERKLVKKIQKGAVKTVDTRQGGPNMPKYQPCPNRHGSKKRTRKTMGGAYYGCKKCSDFFVRAPRL